jgi:hypothetical protein
MAFSLGRGMHEGTMSIRMLAIELYRTIRQVEELEKRLETLAADAPERGDIENDLRLARAERNRIRVLLEGAKDSS